MKITYVVTAMGKLNGRKRRVEFLRKCFPEVGLLDIDRVASRGNFGSTGFKYPEQEVRHRMRILKSNFNPLFPVDTLYLTDNVGIAEVLVDCGREVYFIHNLHWDTDEISKFLLPIIAEKLPNIIVMDESMRQIFKAYLGREVTVLPPVLYPPTITEKREKGTWMWVGSIRESKRFSLAIKLARSRNLPIDFFIDYPVDATLIPSNCRIFQGVDTLNIYQKYEYCLITSYRECPGIAIGEALLSGCKVVPIGTRGITRYRDFTCNTFEDIENFSISEEEKIQMQYALIYEPIEKWENFLKRYR